MADLPEPRVLDPAGVVVSDPDIAGGEPIFRGTRIPVATLFEHLANGYDLDEILTNFPTLDYLSGCETSLARSITSLAFGRTHGSNGG